MNPEEQVDELLSSWEIRSRGYQVWSYPCELHPPYTALLPLIAKPRSSVVIDDGKKPNFFKAIFSAPDEFPKVVEAADSDPIPRAHHRDGELSEVQLVLPFGFVVKGAFASEFLAALHNLSDALSFEIIGIAEGIVVQLCVDAADRAEVISNIKAYFPEIGIRERVDFLSVALPDIHQAEITCIDFGLSEYVIRPLRLGPQVETDPLISVIGSLNELEKNELGIVQVLFRPNYAPWGNDLWALCNSEPDLSSIAPLVRSKFSEQTYSVVIRVMGISLSSARSFEIARRVGGALIAATKSGQNMLIPLENENYLEHDHFLDFLTRTTHRSGMLLNRSELLTLAHLPTASVRSERLTRDSQRTKAAPAFLTNGSFVIGENLHEEVATEVCLTEEQRLKHTWLVGASGTGKSTLLLSMILQDLEQGRGLALLDPHGDLFDEVLARIPAHRLNDVVIIDPADDEFPVGFNILSAHSELERTLLSSDLVGVFQRLSTSWGDQMTSVLGNAVLAFLESSRGGTLLDLRRFLIDPAFRAEFLPTVADSEVVYYWQHEFPLLRGGSQAPLLTRLDSFVRPKLIRYMIAQRSDRLDFRRFMDTKKIVLARLSHGAIGEENAYLLGSLIVSRVNQAAMSRQQQSAGSRVPFFLYLDEFHHFITPSLTSVLSGARKYGLGLVLAHQSLSQLKGKSDDLLGAVSGNAYSRVVFRVGDQDARAIADGLSFFESRDLQGLGVGEAISRVEQPVFDFNLKTSLVPAVDRGTADHTRAKAIALSRSQYAMDREAVVDSLAAITPAQTAPEREAYRPAPKAKPVEPKDTVLAAPAAGGAVAREAAKNPGRGGAQHTYLQSLIKKAAEDRGFRASVELQVLDGYGHVDVALERDECKVACEISVTTGSDHEFGNLAKCIATGFDYAVLVSTDRKFLVRMERQASESFDAEQLSRMRFLTPGAVIDFLDEVATQTQTKEGVVRGYNVRTKYNAAADDDRRNRERIIAEVISKSLRGLK